MPKKEKRVHDAEQFVQLYETGRFSEAYTFAQGTADHNIISLAGRAVVHLDPITVRNHLLTISLFYNQSDEIHIASALDLAEIAAVEGCYLTLLELGRYISHKPLLPEFYREQLLAYKYLLEHQKLLLSRRWNPSATPSYLRSLVVLLAESSP